MKTILKLILVTVLASQALRAEWKKYTLENGAEHVELSSNGKKIYHFATNKLKKSNGNRITIHKFFWNDVLALELLESENQEDLGTICSSCPEAAVATTTVDYNKDGVVDLIRIGSILDKNNLYYGRYSDGVYALVPTVDSFKELMDYLKSHRSEQVGTGQPATRPESKSEGGDKPQPEAEGRSR